MKRFAAAALLTAGAVIAQPQSAEPSAEERRRMEITIERQEDSEWKVIDPGLVLEPKDRVRFRFRSNFDGFLYVMNYGSSGKYELLFPREETGQENEVVKGREYRVPATQAWFRIDGPPGHDVVYWLVTPVELGSVPQYKPLPPPPEPKPPPGNLLPRCDDSIFRARGLCIDSSAGPRAVAEDEKLPTNLAGVPRMSARELVIMRKEGSSLISSPASSGGPVLYEFRIAHR